VLLDKEEPPARKRAAIADTTASNQQQYNANTAFFISEKVAECSMM